MTLEGTVTTFDDQILQEFRNAIRGDVLTAADEGYQDALVLHNGMIDRLPFSQSERQRGVWLR